MTMLAKIIAIKDVMQSLKYALKYTKTYLNRILNKAIVNDKVIQRQ